MFSFVTSPLARIDLEYGRSYNGQTWLELMNIATVCLLYVTIECVLRLQNVFCDYRKCYVAIECVL